MAEADRHQEELMELEKKKAEDMEAARDKDIKQFYADYKVWRIFFRILKFCRIFLRNCVEWQVIFCKRKSMFSYQGQNCFSKEAEKYDFVQLYPD